MPSNWAHCRAFLDQPACQELQPRVLVNVSGTWTRLLDRDSAGLRAHGLLDADAELQGGCSPGAHQPWGAPCNAGC